jgi:Domain of unknown function (DUF4189)
LDLNRAFIQAACLLLGGISASGYAQPTYEQDMARQNQHAYEENMRAQQRRQDGQQGVPPPYQPRQAMKWVSSHGAVVAHMDASNYWAVTGARNFEVATSAALDLCRQAMGEGCMVLTEGRNGHFSIGIAPDGTVAAGFGGTPAGARSQMLEACTGLKGKCREEPFLVSLPWQEPMSWGALETQIADESFSRLQSIAPPNVTRRSHILLAMPKNYSADKSVWIASGSSWDDLKAKVLQACGSDTGVDCEIGIYASGSAVIVEFKTDTGEQYFRTALSAAGASKMVAEHCKKLDVRCTITAIRKTSDAIFERLPPTSPN